MDTGTLNKKKLIIFISDLHLSPDRPEIVELFLGFLDAIAQEAEALYILGDMFDLWLGDDDLTKTHQSVLKTLKRATEKVPVFVMCGNHDFLLGQQFEEQSGCQILKDPHVIEHQGERILLLHGDTLCIEDKEYQRFRAVVHNSWLQKLFLLLPIAARRWCADKLRASTKKYSSEKPQHIMDVSERAVEQVLEKYQASLLIHGHTHRPATHAVGSAGKRIVLGDWYKTENIWLYELQNRGLFQLRRH